MYIPEIWYEAYANLYSNKGAITKGVNGNTMDGFSQERVENIITSLRKGKYRFKPVRRVYIPKHTGNKQRPLSVPSGDDKLVQEVARIILERIYEPVFSDNSHGFRPGRSCHTALEQIKTRWTGIKWFVEFDIRGFFDNMRHEILEEALQKKIADKRFIKLIRGMLRAGYLERWEYHPTYSGAPQGATVSPILSNIYLDALDSFVQEQVEIFAQGKRRRTNPAYQRLAKQKSRIRKQIDQEGIRPDFVQQLKALDRASKEIPAYDPYDNSYKRLKYCRYGDDFIVGVIGSKREAQVIMRKVQTFLEEALELQVAPEKTGIVSASEGVEFLSYAISTRHTPKVIRTKLQGRYTTMRSVVNRIVLRVPERKVQAFCQRYRYGDWQSMKAIHRPYLGNASDVEIISQYNAELRGLANYYSLANDVKFKLSKLVYLAHYSLFKTLAGKHKTRKAQILKKLKQGNEYVYEYEVYGEKRRLRIFRLKHLERMPMDWEVDVIPNTAYLTSPRSELVKRLNCGQCEYCGCTDQPLESHHVRKLKDLRKKPHLQTWEHVMITRNRKTLALCETCHDLLHAGRLPDVRYQGIA
jgi:RNA-directed DNA polymerase